MIVCDLKLEHRESRYDLRTAKKPLAASTCKCRKMRNSTEDQRNDKVLNTQNLSFCLIEKIKLDEY